MELGKQAQAIHDRAIAEHKRNFPAPRDTATANNSKKSGHYSSCIETLKS
jgi:hypothetical protein